MGCVCITWVSHELNGDILEATLETDYYFEYRGVEGLFLDGEIIPDH